MNINAKINKRNAERLLDELMDECKRIGYEHAEDELKSLRAKVETLRQEREELLAVSETLQQAVREMTHARKNPNWFTDGYEGATRHFFAWSQRGLDAASTLDSAIAKVKP